MFFNIFSGVEFMKKMNLSEPDIFGGLVIDMPAKRDDTNKYVDLIWPNLNYPPYVSGGGFIMNSKAAFLLQSEIPKNPLIPIDDAFLGICMHQAGKTENIHLLPNICQWGFENDHDKFNICNIRKCMLYHNFLPEENLGIG
jgi:hypothetical protein